MITLQIGNSTYNWKHNYIRLYIGPSLTEFLKGFPKKNNLYYILNSHLHFLKLGIKLVLDSSSEAEIPFIDLEENNILYRLGWISDWKEKNKIPSSLFEIWVSDFECKKNNKEFGHLFRTVNQYKHSTAHALDNNLLELRNFERKFICAMSRNTKERKSLFEFFESNESLKNMTFYSFNFRENGIYTNPNVDKHLPHLSLERYLNEYTEVYRDEFAGFELQNKSIIHIVCETFFHKFNELNEEQYQRFFTEKTFRPIAMCQPFIYVGMYKMLDKLKSYGFKTFDKWWDESYDDIENDDDRLKAIKKIISDLNKMSIIELKGMYHEMIDVIKYNYNNLLTLDRFYEFHTNYNYNEMSRDEHYYGPYHNLFKKNNEKILTNIRRIN